MSFKHGAAGCGRSTTPNEKMLLHFILVGREETKRFCRCGQSVMFRVFGLG